MPAIRLLAAIVASILLGACSDRSEPDSETDSAAPSDTASPVDEGLAVGPGIRVIDSGAEPRTRLGIAGLGSTTLDVRASSESRGSVGSEPVDNRISVAYRLQVELRDADVPDQLSARFSASDIETSGFSATDPGLWEWRLGGDGALIRVTAPRLPAGHRLRELLSTHGLFLIAPDEPVGAGAVWTYLAVGAHAPTEVRVSRIGENGIEAIVTAHVDAAEGAISTRASGRWDRHRLLASDVTSRIEMTMTATTTRNGQDIPVEMTRVVEFTYGDGQ